MFNTGTRLLSNMDRQTLHSLQRCGYAVLVRSTTYSVVVIQF